MRHVWKAIGTLALVTLAACSDRSAVAPEVRTTPRYNTDPGLVPCTDPELIDDLIIEYFGAGSPDANSALGKWSNIRKQSASGNTADVTAKTWDLVEFLITKQQQGKLPANTTSEALGRALFCFANIDATLPQTRDAWVVYPSDLERTLVTEDGYAGLQVAGLNVEETSLISIVETSDTLRTNLDKYPVNYQFNKYPSNVFVEEVTAAVCGAIPADVADAVLTRMVLGHNKGLNDFELLPKVSVDFLNCAPLSLGSAPRSLGDKLLAMLLPANLYAFGPGAQGIGGQLIEFSPIGPVDPVIKVTPNSSSTSAPLGSLLLIPPAVTLRTERGTLLGDIDVHFTVTGGGGTIAPLTVATSAAGVAASTTWRVGNTAGTNTASAVADIGSGDAVAGVVFDPTVTTFTAQATAPTGIEVSGGPVTAGSYTAGTILPSAAIRVVGEGNRTVEGFTGQITVSATQGGPLFGTVTRSAVAGEVSFADLSIQTAGAAQQLRFAAGSLSAQTGVFAISAGTPTTLVINAGNSQTAPAGTVLGVAAGTVMPSVRVTDVYGNWVVGAPVYFTPSTLAPVTGATNTAGIASNAWTLQAGTNEMLASLDAAPTTNDARFVLFTATGTTTSTAVVSCVPGNQRDPIGSFAVRIDGTNRTVTDARFFLSITGSANALTPYNMIVTATVYGSQNQVLRSVVSRTSTVFLRGNASEQKQADFSFGTSGFVSGNNTRIVFTVAPAATQAVSGTILFNAGTCAPGTSRCATVTNACRAVNEVAIGTPLGTVFRQSPAVRLLGF